MNDPRVTRWIRLTLELWPLICAIESEFGFPASARLVARELNRRRIKGVRGGQWRPATAGRLLRWSRFGERLDFLERL